MIDIFWQTIVSDIAADCGTSTSDEEKFKCVDNKRMSIDSNSDFNTLPSTPGPNSNTDLDAAVQVVAPEDIYKVQNMEVNTVE